MRALRLDRPKIRVTPSPPVRRRFAGPAEPFVQRKGCACGGGCDACRTARVAPADAPAEREADAVADWVMRMESPGGMSRQAGDLLHRMPVDLDAEEEVMAKGSDGQVGPMQAPSSVRPLAGLGPGRPLPAGLRALFEPRFGHEFSAVRIHDGPDAARKAARIDAEAYAYGNHIVFNEGRFAPQDTGGQRLLAHELAHVVQQGHAPQSVHRTPTVTTPSTDQERREFVEATIFLLNESVGFFGDARVQVDAATFDRVMTSWYTMVIRQEEMVRTHLNGDAALIRDLRGAYQAALQVLMDRFAAASGTNLAELYQANNGRIPLWAWPDPRHMELGISTPLARGQAADPLTGNVDFTSNGIAVTILPDGSDPSLGADARTNAGLDWSIPLAHTRGGTIRSIDPQPASTLRIQTVFGPQVSASSPSAYGRGTTPEDQAGAAVTPASGQVGFHEGQHGVVMLNFIATNAPPAFGGQIGMTIAEYNAATAAYHTAMCDYHRRLLDRSFREVDCVGTPRAGSHVIVRGAPCNDTITQVC